VLDLEAIKARCEMATPGRGMSVEYPGRASSWTFMQQIGSTALRLRRSWVGSQMKRGQRHLHRRSVH